MLKVAATSSDTSAERTVAIMAAEGPRPSGHRCVSAQPVRLDGRNQAPSKPGSALSPRGTRYTKVSLRTSGTSVHHRPGQQLHQDASRGHRGALQSRDEHNFG